MNITDERFVEIVRGTSLSNAKLADVLNVSLPTIRRWRNGRNLPTQTMRTGVLAQMAMRSPGFIPKFLGTVHDTDGWRDPA